MDASKVKNAPPAQAVAQTKRTDEARQTQERQNLERQTKAQANEVKKSPYDNPKPTVNGQGQTIGTRLSVTA